MRRIIFLLGIFCALCVAQVNAQFGPAITESNFTVPTNYDNDTQIDVSAKGAKLDKTTYFWSSNLTSGNFLKVTDRLVPGKTYKLKIFQNISGHLISSEACLGFIKDERSILVGAQGLAIVGTLIKNLLPKGKIIVFFDKKDNLWVDTSANNSHGVPFIQTYQEGDYSFNLRYFEYDWPIDICIVCVYEI